MPQTAKAISKYLRAQKWFREYLHEMYTNNDVTNKAGISDYLNGKRGEYTISGGFDWSKSSIEVWTKRNDRFWNWYWEEDNDSRKQKTRRQAVRADRRP